MNAIDQYHGKSFTIYHGDCCEVVRGIPDNRIHFSIHSPPFSSLYIYTDSYRDMGNCKDDDQFFKQYDFLIPELYRVTMPGRMAAVHCKQLVNYKCRDGAAGLRDFRGEIIRHFEKAGWVYHSEVCIWKDPVIEMQRTKSHGLLYKQLRKDSTYSRQGLPDYLLVFRKWAEADAEPVTHTTDDFPLDMWQRYASPVWFDIRQTHVLNVKIAREDADEKHICPLQLDVIERALALWTNPGDIVFSPFAGIGSEIYQAVKMGRRGIGIELKENYYRQAVENCKEIEAQMDQPTLFGFIDGEA